LATAPTTVGVLFSEFVDPASAQTIANYTVSGATVTNVTLLNSGKAVALALNAAVISGATVKVENVKDLATTPNTVASTTLTIAFNDLTSKDSGTVNATNSAALSDPIYVGSTVALGNGAFEVKAGGSDIWNNADGFHYTYKEVTGDFEVKVRVESLQYVSDNWAKAGLMIRESLEGGSRNINTVVDPTAGANIWEPNYRAETNGASSGIPGATAQVPPVTYPNAWIKLARAGQVMTSFKSTNGLDWVTLATYTNTVTTNLYPATMLVGMCATAHNNNGTNTVAEFRDYVLTTSGTVESPKITVSRVKPNLVITWDATKGAGFQLYSAPTIKGTWAVEETAPVTANGVVTVTLPTTEDKQFFQLKK
jgi:regulation of enolase protein 1 (concanavalin A-like superfamily)